MSPCNIVTNPLTACILHFCLPETSRHMKWTLSHRPIKVTSNDFLGGGFIDGGGRVEAGGGRGYTWHRENGSICPFFALSPEFYSHFIVKVGQFSARRHRTSRMGLFVPQCANLSFRLAFLGTSGIVRCLGNLGSNEVKSQHQVAHCPLLSRALCGVQLKPITPVPTKPISQKTREGRGCPKFLVGKVFRQISTLLENSSPIFRQHQMLSLPRFVSGKENGCWKIGPAFGNAPGFSPLRPPQPS